MQLSEKFIVITGASSGIGLATAKGLAAQGASVSLVCRDKEEGEKALKSITSAATSGAPRLFIADLSIQKDIRKLASDLRRELPRIDVLINVAGAAFKERQITEDGVEKTLAINYVSQFLLVDLTLDLIKKSEQGRIINFTAAFPRPLGAEFLDNLQGQKKYGSLLALRHSKLAVIVFTYELARRLSNTKVTVNCLHPGPTRTGFAKKAGGVMAFVQSLISPFLQSPEIGARTPIYLATSPDVSNTTGAFFEKLKMRRSEAASYNGSLGKKLWEISEELTRSKGTIST